MTIKNKTLFLFFNLQKSASSADFFLFFSYAAIDKPRPFGLS